MEYVVGVVARYIQETHEFHWKDEKIILHYVQGTKHFGVHYVAGSPLELVGFANSDWDEIPLKEIHFRLCIHAYTLYHILFKKETTHYIPFFS